MKLKCKKCKKKLFVYSHFYFEKRGVICIPCHLKKGKGLDPIKID